MIYQEFFLSRNRGLPLEKHFPWIIDVNKEITYIYLFDDEELIGGLVIKNCSQFMENNNLRTAAIGLVCVKPEYRGRGYSRVVMESAITFARNEGYKVLTLWTSKRKVYTSFGFQVADNSLYGFVRSNSDNYSPEVNCCNIEDEAIKIIRNINEGVPPFANEIYKINAGNNTIYVVSDSEGPIVTSWKGDEDLIVDVLIKTLPKQWRINVTEDDLLLDELKKRNCILNLKQVNLQMWLSFDPSYSPSELSKQSRFTVIDRI